VMGELDDAFLMLEAVIRGGFVAFVPKSLARKAIREQRVKALATISPETTGIYAVYPEDDTLHLARTAVQRLIDGARSAAEASEG
jgi:DNA-binding transcriptional LysR family regulator